MKASKLIAPIFARSQYPAIHLRIQPDLKRRLEYQALFRKVSLNRLIEAAAVFYLDALDKEKKK